MTNELDQDRQFRRAAHNYDVWMPPEDEGPDENEEYDRPERDESEICDERYSP